MTQAIPAPIQPSTSEVPRSTTASPVPDPPSRELSSSPDEPMAAGLTSVDIAEPIPKDDLSAPVRLLTQRLTAYKSLLKLMIQHFETLVSITSTTSRSLHKEARSLSHPLKEASHFLPEGSNGMIDLVQCLQRTSMAQAEASTRSQDSLAQLVKDLKAARAAVKKQIKSQEGELGKHEKSLRREREGTHEMCVALERSCEAARHSAAGVTSSTFNAQDPYVANLAVKKQVEAQVQQENRHAEALLALQREHEHVEASLVSRVQEALKAHYATASSTLQDLSSRIIEESTRISGANLTQEWSSFAERHDIIRTTPYNPVRSEDVDYPNQTHPYVVPRRVGLLQRKGALLKGWKEATFVLTPAGFLHVFQADSKNHVDPDISMYLSDATLGAHSLPSSEENSFELLGRTRSTGLRMGGGEKKLTIRANTHEEMMEWWKDIESLVGTSVGVRKGGEGGVLGGSIGRTGTVDSSSLGRRMGSLRRGVSGSIFHKASSSPETHAMKKSTSTEVPATSAIKKSDEEPIKEQKKEGDVIPDVSKDVPTSQVVPPSSEPEKVVEGKDEVVDTDTAILPEKAPSTTPTPDASQEPKDKAPHAEAVAQT